MTFSGVVLVFHGVTPRGWADFRGATFSPGEADFGRATFSRSANFGGATFSGWANFGGATFSGGADFREASIVGDLVCTDGSAEPASDQPRPMQPVRSSPEDHEGPAPRPSEPPDAPRT